MLTCIFRTSKQAWIIDRFFDPLPSDLDTRGRKDVFYATDPNKLNSIYNLKLAQHKNSTFIGTIVSKRITLATQLSVLPPYASENYQIANYGLGGQYGIHFDAFDWDKVYTNNDETYGAGGDKFVNKNTGICFILNDI